MKLKLKNRIQKLLLKDFSVNRMIKKCEHAYSDILEYYYNNEEEFAKRLEDNYLRLSGIIDGYHYLGIIDYSNIFDLYTDIDRWKELQIYNRTRRITNG